MDTLIDTIGGLFMLVGATFLLLGSLGLLRMPDTYNRIQAGTKTTTLGTIFTLLGAAFIAPSWGWTLLLIGVFLLFTNPVSSQVLARTIHLNEAKNEVKDMVTETIKPSGKEQ